MRRPARSTDLLAAVLGLCTAAAVSRAMPADRAIGATLPEPIDHVACPSPQRREVTGRTTLEPRCIYTTTVTITDSGTELDCQGSVIDPGTLSGYALHINSRGSPLSNVTVRNCIVRNSNAIAVVIGWRGSDQDKVERYPREEIYRRTPHDIQILNTRVENAKGAGIYVDDYVSGLTMRQVTVRRAESVAVYLEHSSRRITIEDSLFEDNSTVKRREAIAIDSSANNVLRRNVFRRNKAGGVFLYKNCFEHAGDDPKQTRRWQGADGNLIEGNRFEGQPVGVWIGSRQSVDLRKLKCGDPYYGGRFVLDRANGNVVQNNYFRAVDRGVVVEDDRNVVRDNTFEDIPERCVVVGTEQRAKLLDRPVVGVTVDANRCRLRGGSGKGKGIAFLYGSKP